MLDFEHLYKVQNANSNTDSTSKSDKDAKSLDFEDVEQSLYHNRIVRRVVKIVDKILLEEYISKVQEIADSKIVFKDNTEFDQLGIPENLRVLLPMTKEKKAMVYSLCFKWLLAVEKNADLITRCMTYNYTDSKRFKEYS